MAVPCERKKLTAWSARNFYVLFQFSLFDIPDLNFLSAYQEPKPGLEDAVSERHSARASKYSSCHLQVEKSNAYD